jgi:hypothetical protein
MMISPKSADAVQARPMTYDLFIHYQWRSANPAQWAAIGGNRT